MTKTTLKINKGNWSGETGELHVIEHTGRRIEFRLGDRDGRWQLVEHEQEPEDIELGLDPRFTVRDLDNDEDGALVHGELSDNGWAYARSTGVEREARYVDHAGDRLLTAAIASAEVLWNIL